MAIKNYMINDKWLDIDKQNIVEVKSTDGVIGSIKLNGEDYGGGGESSDFSTAKVTLTIGSVGTVGIKGICILEKDGVEYLDSSYPVAENITSVISAVLYKGVGITKIQTDGTITVSGNIQQIAPIVYNITGDCTITISEGESD